MTLTLEHVDQIPDAPKRPTSGHKGTFGRVSLIGGSRGMAGAISLSAQGALHSGAGLVTVCAPDCIVDTIAQYHPAYMTLGAACDGRSFLASATPQIVQSVQGMSAVGLGPGLGTSQDLRHIVHELYAATAVPMVLDADGLNALASHDQADFAEHNGPRVLTPHPGEFARLTGLAIREVDSDRARLAAKFARDFRVTMVLKGHNTVVTDGSRVYVNQTGNSALATGGSGDVLTGVITALLAQGMDGFTAAQFGVHLHGLAGESAGQEFGEEYTTANEILRGLSQAWRQVKASG